MKVIIGGGPAGLYTAIKLRQAGITDIVVIDPRAGKYTRPGHLNSGVFSKAQTGINIPFWPDTYGHIKDLERKLFIEAERLGIRIENKSFVRLSQDAEGVIVTDGLTEEFISADYVFDCTGKQRSVVENLNAICPDSPLQLKTLTEVPVPNHFIAYVHMSETDLDKSDNRFFDISTMNPLEYLHLMKKLRSFGWNEWALPRCYGMPFGKKKDKACLYLQTPPDLSPDRHAEWFKVVLEGIHPEAKYTPIKPSQKFTSKPRFNAFTLTANFLERVAYKGEGLPHVIALGDAQIDPNYYLAHGIYNGMTRIDRLFRTFKIIDGKILYFDAEDYQSRITNDLKYHQEQLLRAVAKEKEVFIAALDTAASNIKQLTLDSVTAHTALLTEIKSRQSYHKAQAIFAQCHTSNKLNIIILSPDTLNSKLTQLHIHSLNALYDLPDNFAREKSEITQILSTLVQSWKELGNALFSKERNTDAMDAYKKSLEIYNIPTLQPIIGNNILPVYSNLIVAQIRAALYQEAIVTAQHVLEILQPSTLEFPANLYEKIVFNFIQALAAQAQECLSAQNTEEASHLHKKARSVIATHKTSLSDEYFSQGLEMIESLQRALTSNPFSEQLQSFGMFPAAKQCDDKQQTYSPEIERSEADAGTAPVHSS